MRHSIKVVCMLAALSLAPLTMAMGPEHGGGMPKGDITKADFLKRMEGRFDQMDTNKDGVLSEAERKAAHDMMRERREQRKADKASAAVSK
jgi:hypothetical protein